MCSGDNPSVELLAEAGDQHERFQDHSARRLTSASTTLERCPSARIWPWRPLARRPDPAIPSATGRGSEAHGFHCE